MSFKGDQHALFSPSVLSSVSQRLETWELHFPDSLASKDMVKVLPMDQLARDSEARQEASSLQYRGLEHTEISADVSFCRGRWLSHSPLVICAGRNKFLHLLTSGLKLAGAVWPKSNGPWWLLHSWLLVPHISFLKYAKWVFFSCTETPVIHHHTDLSVFGLWVCKYKI